MSLFYLIFNIGATLYFGVCAITWVLYFIYQIYRIFRDYINTGKTGIDHDEPFEELTNFKNPTLITFIFQLLLGGLIVGFLGTLVWPLTVTVITLIVTARLMRKRKVNRDEFIHTLKG